VVQTLGKGGQGIVSKVEDTTGQPDAASLANKLHAAMRDMTAVVYQNENLPQDFAVFVSAVKAAFASPHRNM
jgi:hypothetical protein